MNSIHIIPSAKTPGLTFYNVAIHNAATGKYQVSQHYSKANLSNQDNAEQLQTIKDFFKQEELVFEETTEPVIISRHHTQKGSDDDFPAFLKRVFEGAKIPDDETEAGVKYFSVKLLGG